MVTTRTKRHGRWLSVCSALSSAPNSEVWTGSASTSGSRSIEVSATAISRPHLEQTCITPKLRFVLSCPALSCIAARSRARALQGFTSRTQAKAGAKLAGRSCHQLASFLLAAHRSLAGCFSRRTSLWRHERKLKRRLRSAKLSWRGFNNGFRARERQPVCRRRRRRRGRRQGVRISAGAKQRPRLQISSRSSGGISSNSVRWQTVQATAAPAFPWLPKATARWQMVWAAHYQEQTQQRQQ
eukprot:COSAG05_NODE_5168_length_1246_cov_1.348736_2_plen_241_part_00